MERTLVLIKPDAVGDKHIGDIIKIYEEAGLEIEALKLMRMDNKIAAKHYVEHITRPYYAELEEFMTSGNIVAMVIAGKDAISKVRKLNGATDPNEAEDGTVRKLYAKSKGMNAVHASDSDESAHREIAIFFNAQEIFDA